jgi:hypothetical protein
MVRSNRVVPNTNVCKDVEEEDADEDRPFEE